MATTVQYSITANLVVDGVPQTREITSPTSGEMPTVFEKADTLAPSASVTLTFPTGTKFFYIESDEAINVTVTDGGGGSAKLHLRDLPPTPPLGPSPAGRIGFVLPCTNLVSATLENPDSSDSTSYLAKAVG
jgi:hypothetical protein